MVNNDKPGASSGERLASFPGLHPDFISEEWRRRPGEIYHVMCATVVMTQFKL